MQFHQQVHVGSIASIAVCEKNVEHNMFWISDRNLFSLVFFTGDIIIIILTADLAMIVCTFWQLVERTLPPIEQLEVVMKATQILDDVKRAHEALEAESALLERKHQRAGLGKRLLSQRCVAWSIE